MLDASTMEDERSGRRNPSAAGSNVSNWSAADSQDGGQSPSCGSPTVSDHRGSEVIDLVSSPGARLSERRTSASNPVHRRHMPMEPLKFHIPRKNKETRGVPSKTACCLCFNNNTVSPLPFSQAFVKRMPVTSDLFECYDYSPIVRTSGRMLNSYNPWERPGPSIYTDYFTRSHKMFRPELPDDGWLPAVWTNLAEPLTISTHQLEVDLHLMATCRGRMVEQMRGLGLFCAGGTCSGLWGRWQMGRREVQMRKA